MTSRSFSTRAYLVLAFALALPACAGAPATSDALVRTDGVARLRAIITPTEAIFEMPVADTGLWHWHRPGENRAEYFFAVYEGTSVWDMPRGFGWMVIADSASRPDSGSLTKLLRAGRGVRVHRSSCGSIPCFGERWLVPLQAEAITGGVRLRLRRSPELDSLRRARPDSLTLDPGGFSYPVERLRVGVQYSDAP